MDEWEHKENEPWPPEDEDMVLPAPDSDPWAMSLFPDFKPIQTPTVMDPDDPVGYHEEPLVGPYGRMWNAQYSPEHYAYSPSVIASCEDTWEDGLQAIVEFDWSTPETPRDDKRSTQDTTVAAHDAHIRDATNIEQDTIMEDVPKGRSSATPHTAMTQAPEASPEILPDQPGNMENVVEVVVKQSSHRASKSGPPEEKVMESDPHKDDEQEEEVSSAGAGRTDQMEVDAEPEISEGQQIELTLRPLTSTAHDGFAQQKIEKTPHLIHEHDEADTRPDGESHRLSRVREDVSSAINDPEIVAEDESEDDVEVGGSVEAQGNSPVQITTRDVAPASASSLALQHSAPEHAENEEQLHATTQNDIGVPASAAASEGVDSADSKSPPELVVSSPVGTEPNLEDQDAATNEVQDRLSGTPSPKMQVILIPEVTNAGDAEDEQGHAGTPLFATTSAENATPTMSEEANMAPSGSDGNSPARKKLKTSHEEQPEATSPGEHEESVIALQGAATTHRTSLKSPKESVADDKESVDAALSMQQDEEVQPGAPEQPSTAECREDHTEEKAIPVKHDASATPEQPGDDKFEVSIDNDYDMHEHLSDVHSSPAKPSPRPTPHSTPRPSKNSVSISEIMSLSSNLTPNMHIAHGGRATRARKPAVTVPAGYYDEDEEDEEEEEPTPVLSKKKRSSTANKNNLPATKKTKTQQPRPRAAIGIKTEQRRREVSDAEDDGDEEDDAPNPEVTKNKKKGSTKTAAPEAASSLQVVVSKPAPKRKTTSSQASTKSKSKKKESTTTTAADANNAPSAESSLTSVPTSNTDNAAEFERIPTPVAPADDDEDDEDYDPAPTPTPAPAPAPARATARKSLLRKLLPEPTTDASSAKPAPATPATAEEAKRKKFGFKPSPKNTRSRAAKGRDSNGAAADNDANTAPDTTEKRKAKAKATPKDVQTPKEAAPKSKSSTKGKAKANTPVEEPPKTRSAAKKEKRSLRSAGAA